MSSKDKVKRTGDDFIIPANTNDYLYNSMANTQFTYHQYKLTKLLLAITLFFSLFAFGGYAADYPSTRQATKTELVVSNKYKVHKQAVLYHAIFASNGLSNFLNQPAKSWVAALFRYHILTQIKFNTHTKQSYAFKPYSYFVQLRKIPESLDGDTLSALIG